MRDGECFSAALLTSSYFIFSHNAKADPLEQPNQRVQSPSAYAAAMEEFKNGGYYNSDGPSEEI
jgi:hypothetical protein